MGRTRNGRGRPPHPDVLTPGEWRVVEAVRHGRSNPEIARARGISRDAVKFHIANALLKLGLESRRQLKRWDGVSATSALGQRKKVMTDSIAQGVSFGAIGQIARSVADIAAATDFFANRLGLPHLYSFGNLAFFDCDGVRLFLSEGDGNVSESLLYFRTTGIHARQAELEAKGVQFTHAPHMIHRHADGTEEWMAFFADNEGRPLALIEQVPVAA
ncbi:MAG TPA: LuxR C-terminal-related transcriptional regulator [Novosphingobium sp.]|nr:LuxR C-terminal-related transcriptional regulator [Novosphingobium sp.]